MRGFLRADWRRASVGDELALDPAERVELIAPHFEAEFNPVALMRAGGAGKGIKAAPAPRFEVSVNGIFE